MHLAVHSLAGLVALFHWCIYQVVLITRLFQQVFDIGEGRSIVVGDVAAHSPCQWPIGLVYALGVWTEPGIHGVQEIGRAHV